MSEEPLVAEWKTKIMNALGRHFVSLRGISRTPTDVANARNAVPFNFSAFVVTFREDWFLFTAGHILKRIAEVRSANIIVENFRLDDAYHPDAPFKELDALTPFAFDASPKHSIDQPEIGDFAAIWLRQNYRELLSKNKVEPLSPKQMALLDDGTKFIAYWLIGLPEELMSVYGEENAARHRSEFVTIQIERMIFDDLPEAIKSDVHNNGFRKDNFFARIPDASELTDNEETGLQSIVGMSGGPIIGWHRGNDGFLPYSLIAIQSRWWQESRILMACAVTRYVDALDYTIQTASIKTEIAPTAGSTIPNMETG